MSYVKSFMKDYLFKGNEMYDNYSTKYVIYNSKTKKYYSSNVPSLDDYNEYSMEVYDDRIFSIFVADSIDECNSFVDLILPEVAERRIYDYYDFYDVTKSEIDISQEYTIFIDCESKGFNVTITKYSSKKQIDTFEVIHFSRSDVYMYTCMDNW